MLDKKQAAELEDASHNEVQATSRVMRFLMQNDVSGNEVASFDSMLASHEGGREAGLNELPQSLQIIFANKAVQADKQAIFDGISDGVAEYQRRNGGDMPNPYGVAAALTTAASMFGGEKQDSDQPTFDSLTLGHHESMSIVPAITSVVIAYGIANALPIVSMLPNPMGSNELPLVYGTAVAGIDMGVMRRGDAMDGEKAGMPYLENIHVVNMNDQGAGTFKVVSHVAYTAQKRADKTTKFIVDTSSALAPFLGGRVTVMVKGLPVANDSNRDHATTKGSTALQALAPVIVGNKTYVVTQGTANLDTHEVTVKFDTTNGDTPDAEDVSVELIFDYERKDNNGNKILREPSTDLEFLHRSIFAHPSRSRSTATIDAITQIANELGLNWFGAVQTIAMQRYYFEQTGRLLRTAVNMCLSNQDPKNGRVMTFNFVKDGVSPESIGDAFANIRMTFQKARTRLSRVINMPIAGYDIYVSDNGAAFFSGMDDKHYESTNEPYGDQTSVYRIGRLRNSGANVYYVPESMGVFNEDLAGTTAHALISPRPNTPQQAPFVGMIAVPPMVLTSNPDAFERDVAIYSRMGAQVNPIPRYSNQFVLVELLNIPDL